MPTQKSEKPVKTAAKSAVNQAAKPARAQALVAAKPATKAKTVPATKSDKPTAKEPKTTAADETVAKKKPGRPPKAGAEADAKAVKKEIGRASCRERV